MKVLKIKNPVLRYLAGLVTFGVIVVVVVGIFYGVGCLLEPLYARMYPTLALDYEPFDAFIVGMMATSGTVGAIFVTALATYGLANKFYNP